MPKVYIAAAFRQFSQRDEKDKAYGEVTDSNYIDFLERIEDVFLKFGFDTCLPHRDEGAWGRVYYEPHMISSLCYYHVHTSDVVFALAESGRGVHLELGYAAGLGKRIIMMHNEQIEPSTLIYGMPHNLSPWQVPNVGVADAVIATYKDTTDLLNRLELILSNNYVVSDESAQSIRQNQAIIDIGSHTVKLKIFSSRKGMMHKIIYADKKSLGIMGDVITIGAFTDSSIENMISLLKEWKSKCEDFSCELIKVTGTAAIRKSNNTGAFLSRVSKETGFEIEILSPERELEYVYSGVKSTFKSNVRLAVLNLGGGSTQLGIGSSIVPEERMLFDFGTRELTEKWPWTAPMSSADYEAMKDYVRAKMREIAIFEIKKTNRIVHTGGELDFILRCQVPLQISLLSPTHVTEIPVAVFSKFSEDFSRSNPSEIAKNFGLDPAWASGAVASNIIALCAAELVGAEAIIPSNMNISDGILLNV